jgi:hypothetical protein
MGLALTQNAPKSIERSDKDGLPKVEVHSVRPARRVGPDGQHLTDLIIELTQSRRGYFDPKLQKAVDEGRTTAHRDFTFRGGCTIVVDLVEYEVRYCIAKNILSEKRLQQQRELLSGENRSLRAVYFGDPRLQEHGEPLALLHRC